MSFGIEGIYDIWEMYLILYWYYFKLTLHFSPAMVENMQSREAQCAVCRDIWHRKVVAEVYHRKSATRKKPSVEAQLDLSVCMDCILSERLLHGNTSHQVNAFKIQRECAIPGCSGTQSDPMWFCYACFKYICNECNQSPVHSCDRSKVGNKKQVCGFMCWHQETVPSSTIHNSCLWHNNMYGSYISI